MRFLVLALFSVVLVGCGGGDYSPDDPDPVGSIELPSASGHPNTQPVDCKRNPQVCA